MITVVATILNVVKYARGYDRWVGGIRIRIFDAESGYKISSEKHDLTLLKFTYHINS